VNNELAVKAIKAYNAQEEARALSRQKHDEADAKKVALKFETDFGVKPDDIILPRNIVKFDILRFRPIFSWVTQEGWELEVICPDCGEDYWSVRFTDLAGLGEILVEKNEHRGCPSVY
jgi:hypothetical protein